MKNLVNFFIEVGKLKKLPRRGWVIRDIKNPESIAEHTFRVAIMAWVLGNKKKLNTGRILKIALIHDLCKVYSGDITPYDSILPKDKKKRQELLKTWPRFSKKEKNRLNRKKHEKEKAALEKLVKDLPRDLGSEIKHLWFDYEKGLTKEGRFLKQVGRMENFFQAAEYWKKYGKPPQEPWWESAKEFFDDPVLLEFVEEMAKKFHHKIKPRV